MSFPIEPLSQVHNFAISATAPKLPTEDGGEMTPEIAAVTRYEDGHTTVTIFGRPTAGDKGRLVWADMAKVETLRAVVVILDQATRHVREEHATIRRDMIDAGETAKQRADALVNARG